MSDVPRARAIIAQIAAEIGGETEARLREAIALTYRRRCAKVRGRDKMPAVDADTAEAIRTYTHARPGIHIQEVAQVFGVNPGRVSEALHWLR